MPHSATRRPITDADLDFLFEVFCSAQGEKFAALDLHPEQLEQLLRTQFEAQRRSYLSQFPDADFDLVLIDGVLAGNLYAQRGPGEFVLIDITLLPQHRNSGAGGELIRQLIAEANTAGKPLSAHVAKDNPAWHLWQRLGFQIVGDDGVYLIIEVPTGNSPEGAYTGKNN